MKKIKKKIWGGGTAPQTPPPVGRGTPPPHTHPPRRLRRLDPRAYGDRPSPPPVRKSWIRHWTDGDGLWSARSMGPLATTAGRLDWASVYLSTSCRDVSVCYLWRESTFSMLKWLAITLRHRCHFDNRYVCL